MTTEISPKDSIFEQPFVFTVALLLRVLKY